MSLLPLVVRIKLDDASESPSKYYQKCFEHARDYFLFFVVITLLNSPDRTSCRPSSLFNTPHPGEMS